MDIVRKKRVYRLIPIGVVATCLLWGLVHLTAYPSGADFEHPWFYPPDPYTHEGPGRHPPPPPFQPPPSPKEPTLWSARADAVRNAFLHAYRGYIKYAGSNDELLPVTNGAVNK